MDDSASAKKILGIDVDGVLADSMSIWLQELESRHKIKAIKKDLIYYDLTKVFSSLNRKYVRDLFWSAWSNPERVGLEDPEIPQILDNLHNYFSIHITTAAGTKDELLIRWLKSNRIPYDKLVHLASHREKHLLPDVDIYIEDFDKVAEYVSATGKTTILLSQPWNQEFINKNKDPKIIIAYNWREIEQILLEKFKD